MVIEFTKVEDRNFDSDYCFLLTLYTYFTYVLTYYRYDHSNIIHGKNDFIERFKILGGRDQKSNV